MDSRAFSPTKKRRADDFEAGYSTTMRSMDLWFDDGDIVLQAEMTQFRVHRSKISEGSKYFFDTVIESRQRRVSLILVDGCPLVYVQEKAKDWTDLLTAMYNLFTDVYPLDRLLSLLRLGHKYRFEFYRDVAAGCLRNTIPCNSLAEWDASEFCNPVDDQQPLFTTGYEFDLLNAALEAGLQTLLPVVYFLCLRDQGEHRILDGVQHADATFVYLPRRIQHTLIAAKKELTELAMRHTELEPRRLLQDAYLNNSIVCEAPAGHRTCAHRSAEADMWLLRLAREPGLALRSIKGEQMARCIPCTGFLTMHIQEGRERVWEALPLVFGLPARSQLKDAF